jgi:hypothetical protein
MPTFTRPLEPSRTSLQSAGPKRRQPLPLMVFIGVLLAVVTAGALLATSPHLGLYAAGGAVNGDCSLIVPPNPLTAQGLATPYQLVATNPQKGPCHEANSNQAAFVQGAVLDPATGHISIYNPLVIDKGTQPAVAPVVPPLPPGGIVGLWFGSNGTTLTLRTSHKSLRAGHCVNGVKGSIFGQFSHCNAPAFFQAANQAIQAGKLTVPGLGTANNGLVCPSARDFAIVDQDQSDNVTTTYLISATRQIAQDTQANAAALGGQVQKNGSDERLLTLVDTAIGCTPWMAPDLADRGHLVTALPLNELQAAADQKAPIALVPALDPMVLVNNQANLAKLKGLHRIWCRMSLVGFPFQCFANCLLDE